MAGKYQRPQIMPPSGADMRNQESRDAYLARHARRVNDAFAEVYAMLDKVKKENETLRALIAEVRDGGQ